LQFIEGNHNAYEAQFALFVYELWLPGLVVSWLFLGGFLVLSNLSMASMFISSSAALVFAIEP